MYIKYLSTDEASPIIFIKTLKIKTNYGQFIFICLVGVNNHSKLWHGIGKYGFTRGQNPVRNELSLTLNRTYMNIYVYYFFAIVIGLWAYRLCVYFFGSDNPKKARSYRRRG